MSLSIFFTPENRPDFLEKIRCRPMFGGHGYYVNGKIFALVREKSLYLKAGSGNVADFLLMGQLPYIHQCFGEYFPTNFYSVPRDVVVDQGGLARWMEKAIRHTENQTTSKISDRLDSRHKKATGIILVAHNTFIF
ncbi:TfoX/Sxy family protein [Pseudovibrio sp. Tun.PSC04-5.I4]|uniref:TfoX/Sxy family protein n=1 Tax=Pseudovibrio sp. Tun.PSC04-5.I4 TaxID=1798213 RepID=UPI0008801290|nr:TfoX/Sxy family protein [Pseudovibrio sp. Tun.PSC04-5.I4]SDQ98649.1 DNA transformation protein [Pseudovibrio sp. Tun.PSC04-5.I4]